MTCKGGPSLSAHPDGAHRWPRRTYRTPGVHRPPTPTARSRQVIPARSAYTTPARATRSGTHSRPVWRRRCPEAGGSSAARRAHKDIRLKASTHAGSLSVGGRTLSSGQGVVRAHDGARRAWAGGVLRRAGVRGRRATQVQARTRNEAVKAGRLQGTVSVLWPHASVRLPRMPDPGKGEPCRNPRGRGALLGSRGLRPWTTPPGELFPLPEGQVGHLRGAGRGVVAVDQETLARAEQAGVYRFAGDRVRLQLAEGLHDQLRGDAGEHVDAERPRAGQAAPQDRPQAVGPVRRRIRLRRAGSNRWLRRGRTPASPA